MKGVRNDDPVPLTLDRLSPNPIGLDIVQRTTTVLSLKSLRSGVFVLSTHPQSIFILSTHARHDKDITMSAPPFYVIGAERQKLKDSE